MPPLPVRLMEGLSLTLHLLCQTLKMYVARSAHSFRLAQPTWTTKDCNGPYVAFRRLVPPLLLLGSPHLLFAARLAGERHVHVEAPRDEVRCCSYCSE